VVISDGSGDRKSYIFSSLIFPSLVRFYGKPSNVARAFFSLALTTGRKKKTLKLFKRNNICTGALSKFKRNPWWFERSQR